MILVITPIGPPFGAKIVSLHVASSVYPVKELMFHPIESGRLTQLSKRGSKVAPPTPLMLPHKASVSVKIGGYDIPKRSIVHVNIWAIARDPAVRKDPLEFRPERSLKDVDMKGHDYQLLNVCRKADLPWCTTCYQLGHVYVELFVASFYMVLLLGVSLEDIDLMESPEQLLT
ncbi:hypothetical protein HAX54_049154 [Datura stramonium]|uniref:Uncharacterized protein n=1 Tax=Datura stramonium TaxID=4076 RepID=A0ABS8WMB9_DATST|nr:hypothetical protein [Datura stramonium]